MKIKEKQYNYLQYLLKEYVLKKDINNLTQIEASLIIEGILNKGTVKKEFNNRVLSQFEVEKRQAYFDSLVERKNFYATEKQTQYVKGLVASSNYRLKNKKILKKDVNILIDTLKNNTQHDILDVYLEKLEVTEERKLIKLKPVEEEVEINLPKEWIMYNVNINGII